MNNASRVGEIFSQAGNALNLLGELTMQLESAGPSAPGSGTKWTDQVNNNNSSFNQGACSFGQLLY